MAIFLDNPGKYLCSKTKRNLEHVKRNYIDKDFDYLTLIVADKTGVGWGKTTLAQLLCAQMDILNWGIKKRRFSTARNFFDDDDYLMEESKLVPTDSFNFDEPDAFFSLSATSRKQRKLKLKIIHVRQKRYFMTICADSPFTVAKWIRPGGQTRINSIFRIVNRGVALLYSGRTGTMQKIKFDDRQRKITWPAADVIFYFKQIPKKTSWWKDYIKRKTTWNRQSHENPKAVKLMKKYRKKLEQTLTLREIADIRGVHKNTVERWVKAGYFGKRGVFKDTSGLVRIKTKAYYAGIKRILIAKEKGPARGRKKMKAKKKRKRPKRKKKVRKKRRRKK